MKIQRLQIHNIASIEDARIDFTASPLADCDVFLIAGRTGSGKSTILDAVCLALYATTPRLNNTLMEGSVDMAGKEVPLSNPAQMLRKNAGEGFVRLAFEGSDAVPYEAEWSVARSRARADGRLQPRKWSLRDLASGTLYTKESEIRAGIARAVGLTFGQFCRTTLLAQGQFTRFLDSRDEDKAEILEMITGVDIYSKIGVRVFERTREKEAAYRQSKEAAEGVELLTEAQRQEKLEELARAREAVESLSGAMNEARIKAEWLEREAELRAEMAGASAALAGAEAVSKAEAFLSQAALVRSFRETAEARRSLAALRQQNAAAEKAAGVISGLAADYARLRAGYMFLLGRRAALEKSLHVTESALAEGRVSEALAGSAAEIFSRLDMLKASADELNLLKGSMERIDGLLNDRLLPQRRSAEEALSAARNEKSAAADALKAAEDAVVAAGLPQLRKELRRLVALKGAIDAAELCIKSYKEISAARAAEAGSIENKEKETAAKQEYRATLYAEVCELKAAFEIARHAYEVESLAGRNFIADMRRRLAPGDLCPVCMREITAMLPDDAEVAARLKPAEDACKAAEAAYEAKKEALDRLDADIFASIGQIRERRKAFEADMAAERQRGAVMDALRNCGIEDFDAGAEFRLGELYGNVGRLLADAELREKSGAVLEDRLAKARDLYARAAASSDTARETLAEADDELKRAQAELEKTAALMASRRKDAGECVLAIDGMLEGSAWGHVWREAPDKFRSDFSCAVGEYNAAHSRKRDIENALRPVLAEIAASDGILREIEAAEPSWGLGGGSEMEEVEGLPVAAAALKERLAMEKAGLAAAKAEARRHSSELDAFLAEHPSCTLALLEELSLKTEEEIRLLEQSHREVAESVLAAKACLDSAGRRVEEHAGKRPELQDGDSADALRRRQAACNEAILAKTREVSLLEAALKEDECRRKKSGELACRAEAMKKERDRWAALNELIGDSSGKKFRKIAQSYVLGSLIAAANHYMRELTDRYTLELVPGTFVILLEDAYQGFERRPACTGSGGEGFLVSLALALALSDIGDGLSADTLFIDEGFGTLSGEPLRNAIDTLKTLKWRAGRKVGIISHIEELRERIPVKIELVQEQRSSGSTVRVLPESQS